MREINFEYINKGDTLTDASEKINKNFHKIGLFLGKKYEEVDLTNLDKVKEAIQINKIFMTIGEEFKLMNKE